MAGKRYTPDEDEAIVSSPDLRATAEHLGRSYESVLMRRVNLRKSGVAVQKKHRLSDQAWSAVEDQLVASSTDLAETARMLRRTRSAVLARRNKLRSVGADVSDRPWHRGVREGEMRWTPELDAIVLRADALDMIDEAAELMDTSADAVRARLRRLAR